MLAVGGPGRISFGDAGRVGQVPDGTVQAPGACTNSDECAGAYGHCNEIDRCELRGADDYEVPCDSNTDCPSGACFALAPNVQSIFGFCTRYCTDKADCGVAGDCVPNVTASGDNLCVSKCVEDADCGGGFECWVAPGDTVGFCTIDKL